MATPLNMYSDAFATLETAATQTVNLPEPGYRAASQRHHADVKLKNPKILIDLTGSEADDKFVMAKFKSGDCIGEIFYSDDAAGANLAGDLGLYLIGPSGDVGTVVDVDLYASAVAMDGATRTEVFTEASLTQMSRWLPIWETLGLSADPFLNYYLAFTVTTALITTDKLAMLEIKYTEI